VNRRRSIEKLLKALRQQLKSAVGELDLRAAKLVEKGAYASSQQLIESAQEMRAFGQQVDALWESWRGALSKKRSKSSEDRTPLWEYYPLIATILMELGGEAQVRDVIAKVQSVAGKQLRSGDLTTSTRGRPVWEHSIRRARNPMIDEGFLESVPGGRWRLTNLGQELTRRPKAKKQP
jgi:hypothetical protein